MKRVKHILFFWVIFMFFNKYTILADEITMGYQYDDHSFLTGYFRDENLSDFIFKIHKMGYLRKGTVDIIMLFILFCLVFVGVVFFFRFYIKALERRIKSSNKEMMLQRAYFRQLFESSPQATVILDLDDTITDANIGFERLFGYAPEEIIGKRLSPLILPEGKEANGVAVNNIIITRKIFQKEVKRKKKDGTIIDVSLLGLPIIHEGESIGVYGIYTDISDKKRQEELMKRHAYYDCLTDLPNRNLLMKQLKRAIEKAEQNNKIIAVLFMDLDRFKSVNDSYGHNVGDKLLIGVGSRLNKAIRVGDMAARMGGDEFIMMLQNIDNKDVVYKIVHRIHKSLNMPHLIEGHHIKVTASIGIAFFPKDGKDAETLLKNADDAMYIAKKKGRNNYQVYS